MYLADPDQGAARRARLRAWANDLGGMRTLPDTGSNVAAPLVAEASPPAPTLTGAPGEAAAEGFLLVEEQAIIDLRPTTPAETMSVDEASALAETL